MIARSAFRPAWWLPGPHLQTLYPSLLRRRPAPALSRERVELPDGDFLDLAWTPDTGGPLALVLHGLEGSMRSHYAGGLLAALWRADFHAALMHFRGCGGEPNRLARGYHSGETGDVGHVAALLRTRHPERHLTAVGISLGGNVLLKWLGEAGADSPVAAAVAVSVPMTLAAAAARLDRGLSRLYQRNLVARLRRSVAIKAAARDEWPVTPATLAGLRSFRAFDDAVTAPLHGFRDADDYYRRASSRPYLSAIRTPTLIIQSRDDPFMDPEGLPDAGELSGSVTLELSERGGHVGFIAGRVPWRPRYWLEERVPGFLNDALRYREG